MISVMIALSIISGLFVAYFLDNKENEILFLPLAIGFVFVCIAYFFIEKKAELKAGCKVDKY